MIAIEFTRKLADQRTASDEISEFQWHVSSDGSGGRAYDCFDGPGGTANVLIAFADDWGRYASAYAKLEPGSVNDLLQTPNFDRLAARGVLFTRAFVNSPSCTPCRSSLLSGQYFWRTGRGAILQGAIWDSSIPSFPLLLEDAGYFVGHTGKVWSPGTPANAPIGAQRTAFNAEGHRFNNYSEGVSSATDPTRVHEDLLQEVRANFRSF